MNLLITINKSSIIKVLDDIMKNSCISFLFFRMSTLFTINILIYYINYVHLYFYTVLFDGCVWVSTLYFFYNSNTTFLNRHLT